MRKQVDSGYEKDLHEKKKKWKQSQSRQIALFRGRYFVFPKIDTNLYSRLQKRLNAISSIWGNNIMYLS